MEKIQYLCWTNYFFFQSFFHFGWKLWCFKSSCYNFNQWNRDFEQSQCFKKNICEFPCIDFHKTKRGLGEETFNRIKKEYSNSIINNDGNYFQRAKFKNINLFSPINKNNEENGKI